MLPCRARSAATYCEGVASSPLPGAQSLFEDDDPMLGALLAQAKACNDIGSAMYTRLFHDLADDYADNGRTFAILAGRSARPIHDAIPLRLAAAVHRIVLSGRDERLARHYPSVGGKPGHDFTADFIAYMRDHIDEIDLALTQQVQTNEVGRSIVHLTMSHWLTTQDIATFDLLELGASAGLNLNFDKYYACSGQLRMGDSQSQVRFMGDYFTHTPNLPKTGAQVHRKRGVDISPLDVTQSEDETRLLSFFWPDQKARLERTRAAIEIAKVSPPLVDTGSADIWLQQQLSRPFERATVVFHSIVWQYLGAGTQNGVREALASGAQRATPQTPLLWVRMEPAGPVADVQVDVWDGSSLEPIHSRLAEVGYHGQNMNWLA